jgi:simple sugar transport system permease protein
MSTTDEDTGRDAPSLKQVNSRTDASTRALVSRLQMERGTLRMLVLTVAAFLLFTLLKPGIFLDPLNITNMAVAAPEVGLLAIAVMLAMLTGGIDLSVVAIANGTAITIAGLSAHHPDAGGAAMLLIVLAGFVVGLLGGAVNGVLISRVGITPILATLGTMQVYNGLAIVYTGGKTLYGVPAQLTTFAEGTVARVPILFVVFVLVAVAVAVLLNRTPLGLKLLLQGSNEKAARFSGIRPTRTLMATYTLSGALAAIAGIFFVARNPTASADYGSSYVLLVIVIAILGGTNPSGGFGTVTGVVLATLTLQIVQTGFNIMRLSNYEYAIAQGLILIVTLVIDQISRRRQASRPSRTRKPIEPSPEVAAQ